MKIHNAGILNNVELAYQESTRLLPVSTVAPAFSNQSSGSIPATVVHAMYILPLFFFIYHRCRYTIDRVPHIYALSQDREQGV
jgi:predicted secreted protein